MSGNGFAKQFALWSRTYDDSPNPMLSLEERFLTRYCPSFAEGCAGCGLWDRKVAGAPGCVRPRSMTGIDFSPEMLDRARRKLGREAVLVMGNATSLPIAKCSLIRDCVVCCQLCRRVTELAAELRRVAGATAESTSPMFIPAQPTCNWKRGFREGGHDDEVSITSSVGKSSPASSRPSLKPSACLSRRLDLGTWNISHGRQAGGVLCCSRFTGHLYLELQPVRSRSTSFPGRCERTSLEFTGARVSLDAEASIHDRVQEGRIASIPLRTYDRNCTQANRRHWTRWLFVVSRVDQRA